MCSPTQSSHFVNYSAAFIIGTAITSKMVEAAFGSTQFRKVALLISVAGTIPATAAVVVGAAHTFFMAPLTHPGSGANELSETGVKLMTGGIGIGIISVIAFAIL